MKTVYQTMNGVDASIVADLLARAGIDSRVVGQEMGPYTHALGAVRVVVDAQDEARAQQVVGDWEAEAAAEPPARRPRLREGLSRDGVLLVIGFVVLLVAVWYFTGGPGAR